VTPSDGEEIHDDPNQKHSGRVARIIAAPHVFVEKILGGMNGLDVRRRRTSEEYCQAGKIVWLAPPNVNDYS
jgi:hypothetical protein